MSACREWGGVVCDNERTRKAVLSWFQPLVPETWGLPIYAQLQEDIATGRETAMRALFRLEDGRLKEAYRAMNKRNCRIKISDATPALLKAPWVNEVIAKAEAASSAKSDVDAVPGMNT